jgi:transporter family-2 protein
VTSGRRPEAAQPPAAPADGSATGSDGQARAQTSADLVLMVLAGGLLAGQARINGSLDHRLGGSSADAVLTAFVSFAFGTVVLLCALLITRRGSRGSLRSPTARIRWWFCIGGLGGAALVSASAAAAPVMGVALLSVCTVAGQTTGSLAVDEAGFAPSGRQPVTGGRMAGALLAIIAMVIGAAGQRHGTAAPGLYLALGGAGVLVAGQQAVNGRLSQATGSPTLAAAVSFAGGTIALGLSAAVLALTSAYAGLEWPSAPWLYVGGLGGAIYIALGAATVARLGVLRLTLASVAGQLAGSMLLDVVAPAGEGLSATTVLSVCLTFGAVALVGRLPRPSRAGTSPEMPA